MGYSWTRDFKRDPNNPAKFERYEAEALAHRCVPVNALLGIACFNEAASAKIANEMAATGVALKTVIQPSWYFQ